MRVLVAVILLAVVAASLTAYGFRDVLAGWIGVRGTVNVGEVWMKPRSISVDLNITRSEGEALYRNIAVLHVPSGGGRVLFRVFDKYVEGDVTISMSGQIVLEGPSRHIVNMPCMLSTGGCVRILVLIPGYDAPLRLPGGDYNVSLKISWVKAKGSGEVGFKIGVLDMSSGEALLELVSTGERPVNTTGWTMAKGSTRSYALLVESVEAEAGSNGYGSVETWAWMFSPSGKKAVFFNYTLLNTDGKPLATLNIPVRRNGTYYQAIVLIKAKPGQYRLKLIINGNTTLETPIITIRS